MVLVARSGVNGSLEVIVVRPPPLVPMSSPRPARGYARAMLRTRHYRHPNLVVTRLLERATIVPMLAPRIVREVWYLPCKADRRALSREHAPPRVLADFAGNCAHYDSMWHPSVSIRKIRHDRWSDSWPSFPLSATPWLVPCVWNPHNLESAVCMLGLAMMPMSTPDTNAPAK